VAQAGHGMSFAMGGGHGVGFGIEMGGVGGGQGMGVGIKGLPHSAGMNGGNGAANNLLARVPHSYSGADIW